MEWTDWGQRNGLAERNAVKLLPRPLEAGEMSPGLQGLLRGILDRLAFQPTQFERAQCSPQRRGGGLIVSASGTLLLCDSCSL